MDIEYKNLVKYLIKNFVEVNDNCSLDDILSNFSSLFPNDLLSFIRDLKVDIYNRSSVNKSSNIENSLEFDSSFLDFFSNLNLSHSLDSEWYFELETLKKILFEIVSVSPIKKFDNILFLGAPVLGNFASYIFKESNIFILDKNKNILSEIFKHNKSKNLNLLEYNVESPIPRDLIGKFDLVFFDPPWYEEYYKAFLERSLSFTFNKPAIISYILFPIFMRPKAMQERLEIDKFLIKNKINKISISPSEARYLTPHFEKQIIKDCRLSNVNWRTGDLVIAFCHNKNTIKNRPIVLEKTKWNELIYNNKKIKIKIKNIADTKTFPKLINIAKNDKIDSVSRRDPIREQIDFWISDNTIYALNNSYYIYTISKAICDGMSNEEIIVLLNNDKKINKINIIVNEAIELINNLRNIITKGE